MDNLCLENRFCHRCAKCKYLEINEHDALAGFMLTFSELAVAAPVDLRINYQRLLHQQAQRHIKQTKMKSFLKERADARRLAAQGLVLLCLFGGVARAMGADAPVPTEQQSKAVCLLNFTKYVDWPAGTFAETNSPLNIGCTGDAKAVDCLKAAAEGKLIGGHPVAIVAAGDEAACEKCQVLFICASGKRHQSDILKRMKAMPVLTVGESDQFLSQGGVINFTKKDDKIHFEVNVAAAQAAHLEISSRLLSLADRVQTKP